MEKLGRFALYAFYPIMFFVYFLLIFKININSLVGIPILLFIICYSFSFIGRNSGKIHNVVLFFLIYNLASAGWYAFHNVPLSCYSIYLRQFVFPILFFFFGESNKIEDNRLFKIFGYSCLLCFSIGLFLYISSPDFYISYLNDARHAKWFDESQFVNESNILAYTRFSAFWATPYAVSYLGLSSFCISFLLLKRDHEKSNVWYLLLTVSMISAILCFQRIAMGCVVLFLLIFIFSGYLKAGKSLKFLLIVFLLIFFVLPYMLEQFGSRFSILQDQLFGRLDLFSFSQAMSEGRDSQYDLVLENWKNIPFGSGLGSASGAALSFGFPGVTDGEYFRILVETGVIGLLIFAYICISTLFHSFSYRLSLLAETLVVIYFLLACFGSNALSIMHIFAPMFWFCLGRIWNNQYTSNVVNI